MLVVVVLFGVAYASALTFEYIEGDDATTVAYHAVGRDPSIQLPYSPYHALIDRALSILPPSEPVLRIAISIGGAVGALCFTLLVLRLNFDWFPGISELARAGVAMCLVFASPELLYLGLLYSPVTIGLSFTLGAHLVARRATLGARIYSWKLIASALLFGMGVACRWGTVLYAGVILADLVLLNRRDGQSLRDILRVRWAAGVRWGVLAAVSAIGWVLISGVSWEELQSVAALAGRVLLRHLMQTDSLVAAANISSLVTPGFLLLVLIGCRRAWAVDRLSLVPVLVGTLVVLPRMASGVPKAVLVAFPGWVFLVTSGLLALSSAAKGKARVGASLMIVLVLPWTFGCEVYGVDSSWGPGFELRGFDQGLPAVPAVAVRWGSVSLVPVVGSGAALPTMEGPRPLGGHFETIVGGRWRALIRGLARERLKLVEKAVASGLPILLDRGTSLIYAELLRVGFETTDPEGRITEQRPVRRFFRRTTAVGQSVVTTWRLDSPKALWSRSEEVRDLRDLAGTEFLLFGYSSTLRRLASQEPDSLIAHSPQSATLLLD